MSMTTIKNDPISDMLTRIRNAVAVHKTEIFVPHSKSKEAVARILADNKFLHEISVEDAAVGKMMKIVITPPATPARINEISRLSKPGRRSYASAETIPIVKRGRGIVIVSTSRGMVTGEEAKRLGVGGELICKVY